MQSAIAVPKIINVGYQNRKDTYTGKLAYIIYTDESGKLRKENSWNSWRDTNIEPDTYDNVPTSGFVLNKKVGDTCSHWNFRQAYCRVYDPRGFEFEITIENLLYILENTSSIVGKGLDGEFVYGWDGKDLVLLPINSPDYKAIQEYTNALYSENKITAKSLKVGATYLGKDNSYYIYLGKYMEYDYLWGRYNAPQNELSKNFWFWKIDNNNPYPFTIDLGEYDILTTNFKNNGYGSKNGGYLTRKSIPKNFLISVVDESESPYLGVFIDYLNHLKSFSKINLSACKYTHFTQDEFLNYVKTTWESHQDYKHKLMCYNEPITFFTEPVNGVANNYTIAVNSNQNRKWDEPVNYNDIKLYRRTLTKDNSYRTNYYNTHYTDEIEEIGALTDDKIINIYNRYKPCYLDLYLENGIHYQRVFEYLPMEGLKNE